MKAAIRITALALLLMPAIVSAQEPRQHPLAGSWRGPMVAGAAEDADVTIELRIDGDTVTGPISTLRISDISIGNGSVTGNSVRFTSPNLDPDNQGVVLVWTGQLTGSNELAFSVVPESGGAAQEFVLTKRLPTPGGGR